MLLTSNIYQQKPLCDTPQPNYNTKYQRDLNLCGYKPPHTTQNLNQLGLIIPDDLPSVTNWLRESDTAAAINQVNFNSVDLYAVAPNHNKKPYRK